MKAETDDVGSAVHHTNKLKPLVKHPAILILLFLLILWCCHPALFNLKIYLGQSEESIPLNYVSNAYLWTRNSRHDAQKILVGVPAKLENTHFRNRKTYIIVHGFTGSGLDEWIHVMKDALLWRENCNVISVDWQAGSLTAGYYVIQARVPDVGKDIVQLLDFLRNVALLSPQNVHLIGHSLGAHVVGFAGKLFNGTINRITGLDPAGLKFNGVPSENRLDKSDASFVDVIHTHGCYTFLNQWTDCYGTNENMGDADFWPNGGEDQPACHGFGDGARAVRNGSNCHHGMAYAYYTATVYFYSTSTRFLSRKCDSWDLFNNGSCDCSENRPQYMGHNADPRVHGVFYLNTSHINPYGILEPNCSPKEYSLLRIIGIGACLLTVLFSLVHSLLSIISSHINKDLRGFIYTWLNEKSSFLYFLITRIKLRKE